MPIGFGDPILDRIHHSEVKHKAKFESSAVANKALFESLKKSYDRTKKFDLESELLNRELSNMADSFQRSRNKFDTEKHIIHNRLSSSSRHNKFRIAPLDSHFINSSKSEKITSTNQFSDLSKKLIPQKDAFKLLREKTSKICTKKIAYCDLISGHRVNSENRISKSNWHEKKSELMNLPSTRGHESISPEKYSATERQPLFTSPVLLTCSRKQEWNESSHEKSKLDSLNFSTTSDLNKIDATVAARKALGKFKPY